MPIEFIGSLVNGSSDLATDPDYPLSPPTRVLACAGPALTRGGISGQKLIPLVCEGAAKRRSAPVG
jgi:hypothetical protein